MPKKSHIDFYFFGGENGGNLDHEADLSLNKVHLNQKMVKMKFNI